MAMLVFSLTTQIASAGSATWNAEPPLFVWDAATDWTPNTIPDGPDDIATFDVSDTTGVQVAFSRTINSIVFDPGASGFTLISECAHFAVSGAGLINNSGIVQQVIVVPVDVNWNGGLPYVLDFHNEASAGELTQITTEGGLDEQFGGVLEFYDTSNAGAALITNEGSSYQVSGVTSFYDSSSAADSTITNEPGLNFGGACEFNDTSSAGNAIIVNQAVVSNGVGGEASFHAFSDAANSTITCNGSTGRSHAPAEVEFLDDSTAENARVILHGDGQLSVGQHNRPGITIGSLEGDGVVQLTFLDIYDLITLSVGSSNLSTTFSGVIQDRSLQKGGSIAKVGTGTLTLTGANTYAGSTTVEAGTLLINNTTGSGTGGGTVRVRGGILGGDGIIGGPVIVGTGQNSGAVIGPGANSRVPGTLTIQKKLTLKPDATYRVLLNSNTLATDSLLAKGVSLSGAQIIIVDGGNSVLTPGTALTLVNNTALTPIVGTFGNLVDGGRIRVGRNTFQANYEGGDGNDLTVTVVQ
jgi:autotransporter-associated beta strand protein